MKFIKLGKVTFLSILIIKFSIVQVFAEKIEIAEGMFYNGQYKRAINLYKDALHEVSLNRNTKINIKYKIGLSYFLLGEPDNSLKYWAEAREENPGIFEGKIFRIPSVGMEPTLVIGDLIIVDTEYYNFKNIQRGDVVTFLSPQNSKTTFIKRVIGLPGETIEIKDNKIFINGNQLFDKFGFFSDETSMKIENDHIKSIKIPMDNYFLIGDNRNQSFDSRSFGPVKRDLIFGKALVIYGTTSNNYSLEGSSDNRSGKMIK